MRIPRHTHAQVVNVFQVGTHKHDRHLELYYANYTTIKKETTHSKAVMNFNIYWGFYTTLLEWNKC